MKPSGGLVFITDAPHESDIAIELNMGMINKHII
jgi:hypothetical protein